MAEVRGEDSLTAVFQDEVHFQQQATLTASWHKKGSKPQVKSFPGHCKISYSGFVIPETGELFVCKPERFNTATTIESIRAFLKAHPAPKGKKYALVMDNAAWHKSVQRIVGDERRSEYSDIYDSVVFIKMPPYSPDFNPIEQVWRITRRENTHNKFFDSISATEKVLDMAFAQWASPNEQLRSLCDFM